MGRRSRWRFREDRDQIEAKVLHWLEHPEEEIAKLDTRRERERRARGYESLSNR